MERWWSGEHTYSGDAANLSFALQAGACFCERWQDNAVEHGRAVMLMRDRLVRLSAALGPLQNKAVNGVLTFLLKADEGGTSLTVGYRVDGTVRQRAGQGCGGRRRRARDPGAAPQALRGNGQARGLTHRRALTHAAPGAGPTPATPAGLSCAPVLWRGRVPRRRRSVPRERHMLVGVPKEIKVLEHRVGLTPASVREVVHRGHQAIVEHGAGGGSARPTTTTRAPARRSPRPRPRSGRRRS